MREYKLIPLQDVHLTTAGMGKDKSPAVEQKADPQEKNNLDLNNAICKQGIYTNTSPSDEGVTRGGRAGINNYLTKMLQDKTISNDFKLKLLTIYGQTADEKNKQDNTQSTDEKPDLFYIVVRTLAVQNNIPNALKIYHYLKKNMMLAGMIWEICRLIKII